MISDPHTARIVHYFFEWLALATGLFAYRTIRKKGGAQGLLAPGSFAMVVGCLIGAGIGNKLVSVFEDPGAPAMWLGGQSIVGALLGGWIGVEIGKRIAGNAQRTGDDFVVPILTGVVIGRIGCFLAGLNDGTYGLPTNLPWAVDFGDGLPRHPTQLYECFLALLALVAWPQWRKLFANSPGLAFRATILGYLLWRLCIDSLKPVPFAYALGLSGIQWVCAIGMAVIIVGLVRDQGRPDHA